MTDSSTYKIAGNSNSGGNQPPSNLPTIIINNPGEGKGRWLTRILVVLLILSVLINLGLMASHPDVLAQASGPREVYFSGDQSASKKIALIEVRSMIAGSLTDRTLKIIKKARDDKSIEGVVLVVDSPGGLVADSHEIYDRLKTLSESKPVYVSMRRLAASGGYYIAMGAGTDGKIYAEPTTWTGSIGVIMPRYDLSEFADKWGIKSDPLTTGEFKDTLNPLKKTTEEERALWKEILDESYERFVSVIESNREGLDTEGVKKLATGQIFTANQALENKMIDKIGYLEDAIDDLKAELGGTKFKVIRFSYPPTISEAILGSMKAQDPKSQWKAILELTVPKAMYLASGNLGATSE